MWFVIIVGLCLSLPAGPGLLKRDAGDIGLGEDIGTCNKTVAGDAVDAATGLPIPGAIITGGGVGNGTNGTDAGAAKKKKGGKKKKKNKKKKTKKKKKTGAGAAVNGTGTGLPDGYIGGDTQATATSSSAAAGPTGAGPAGAGDDLELY